MSILSLKLEVSGVEFSRDMTRIFGASDGIRTVNFPDTIRAVRQESFCDFKSLQSVILNEGLEVLGTDEYRQDGKEYSGVFQESGLKRVKLPSTLKRIEYRAFTACESLKCIDLPESLEYIGERCF